MAKKGNIPWNKGKGTLRSKHLLYGVWSNMMTRCYNEKATQYKYYGSRGIKVCRRWHNFLYFAMDMFPRSPGMSLDRKNNDGNYSLSNCKWSNQSEQLRNRRNLRSKTGFNCVEKTSTGYRVSYYVGGGTSTVHGKRYNLGDFDNLKEAVLIRDKFSRLYNKGDERWHCLVSSRNNPRLQRNSSTKIKGITKHSQGFIVRRTVDKKRFYLGFVRTVAQGVKLLERVGQHA